MKRKTDNSPGDKSLSDKDAKLREEARKKDLLDAEFLAEVNGDTFICSTNTKLNLPLLFDTLLLAGFHRRRRKPMLLLGLEFSKVPTIANRQQLKQ